jgi:hypothetical protein
MAQTPPIPFDVKAISAYTARNGNELSLEVGKVYRVLATDGRGVWWQSKTDEGQVGWFPANYTTVIESAPPPVVQQAPPEPQPQPQPVSARPAGVETAAQPQVQPISASQSSAQQPAVVAQSQPNPSNGQAASNSVPSDRGQPIKTSLDPALNAKPPLKDPCTVTVHLVESTHNTLPSGKSPSVFVYKKQVTERDIKKVKPLFSLANKAKAGPFKWGEAFSIYIKDAEMDVICLRFNFKDAKSDSGFIGEIEFPLRGAVRKFDKPNGIFQWWPLKKGNDSIGQALIFIEYCDPRPFSGPSDVQHKGHVGITSGGGFEIRDIPQEWKQLFRVLNIKKKDLENNAEMAQEVLGIMQQAVKDGVLLGNAGAEPISNHQNNESDNSNHHAAAQHHHTAAATPVVSTPQVTHQEQTRSTAAPPPPPPSGGGGPKPPPPPPMVSGGGPKPPAPPPPVKDTAPSKAERGGGQMSLLEQIQRGTSLKPAQIKDVQTGTASTGNPLADTLLNAMSKYRVDIEGKDNDDADDWD